MTKQQYTKPYIQRQVSGMMNKFGQSSILKPMTDFDSIKIEDLVEQYGSPLFVFSQKRIQQKYRELSQLLKLQYSKVQLSWSYKTNYLDAICRCFHREGAWAEVVSEFEYDKAIHLGVPPSTIVVNGPMKSGSLFKKCFKGDSLINLDHFDELCLAEKVAS
ncbi:unnamed protein product, partial [marine sediment metagenome]